MGLFDRFPYSNEYRLNLDWIIAKIKQFESDYNQLDPNAFLRKSGGEINGTLRVGEGGSIDMSGRDLTGLKDAVNSGDAVPLRQAEASFVKKAGDTMTGSLNMDGNSVTNIPAPVAESDAANKKYVDDKIGTPEAPGAYLPLAGGMMSGDINMDGHELTGIQNPINGLDAVNKSYLDGINGAIRQWATQQFAPTGLVKESVSVASETELDNTITAQFESMNAPSIKYLYVYASQTFFGGSRAIMAIEKLNATDGNVILYAPHTNGVYITYKAIAGSVIAPLEWVNPPMAIGVEYRTVERWNGKPVYTKLVDCGSMPSNTYKSLDYHDGAWNVVTPVRASGMAGGQIFPTENWSGSSGEVKLKIGYKTITIATTLDLSGYAGLVTVYYIYT